MRLGAYRNNRKLPRERKSGPDKRRDLQFAVGPRSRADRLGLAQFSGFFGPPSGVQPSWLMAGVRINNRRRAEFARLRRRPPRTHRRFGDARSRFLLEH